MYSPWSISLSTFVFAAILFIIPVSISADACVPHSDYWFLEAYEINSIEPELPTAIQVDVSSLHRRGNLKITNQGDGLLYLLPRDSYDDVVVETRRAEIGDALADEDQISQTVLLFDKIPALASATIQASQALHLDIANIPALVDDRLEDHNVLTESWNSFIVIPPPLRTELYLVYAEQIYEVTFTIRYKLNLGFLGKTCTETGESTPVVQSINEPEPETSVPMWVLGGLVFYFLGVMLFVGWRLLGGR